MDFDIVFVNYTCKIQSIYIITVTVLQVNMVVCYER